MMFSDTWQKNWMVSQIAFFLARVTLNLRYFGRDLSLKKPKWPSDLEKAKAFRAPFSFENPISCVWI